MALPDVCLLRTSKVHASLVVDTLLSPVHPCVRTSQARITTTREHPFYVRGRGFVLADGLAVGNAIVTRAGPALVVQSTRQNRRAGGFPVYNFVVEDDHSYFVGTHNGGAWVHNPEGDCDQEVIEIADRVMTQLQDPRLGPLAGNLSPERLRELAVNPGAQRMLDSKSGYINVVQEVDGVLLRITRLNDTFRIISVGPIRPNGVVNWIASGRYVPLL